MTAKKVRWGILGVAKINDRLLPGFAMAKQAELRGIASRSLERAKSSAAAAGIPQAFGSYEDLLADPAIDAVYIPLPNTLHAEWTRKAADRGKHILCEKPLTPTAGEAQALVDYCRAKGVKLMDGFMWPHHPRTAKLRQFLDAGGIGPVQRVTGAFTFRMESLSSGNIRLQPNLAGGSLLDVGCYPIYGIRWAFGAEPVRVFASARYLNEVDIELNGLLWFADGRMAAFDCGFTMPLRGWLEISGPEGMICVPEMWLPSPHAEYQVHRDGKPVEKVTVEGHDQIAEMIDDFNWAILEDVPVTPSPQEAVKTLKVLDALAKSAKEGKMVEV